MRGSIAAIASLWVFVFVAGGCQEADVPASTADVAAAKTDTGNRSTPDDSDVQPAESSDDSDSEAVADQTKTADASPEGNGKEEPKEQFKPPFPHRVDFFAPPHRVQPVATKTTEDDETVELHGFANVGELKVVLAVDGIITPIPQGGKKFGIEVITISPPTVVLQRGRERWTATLEN